MFVELCVRMVLTKPLQHPTPELVRALGGLMYALGDVGSCYSTPHLSCGAHSRM